MANKHGEIRLFLGIPIATSAIAALAKTAEALRQHAYDEGFQIRWVAPINYHITVKFLGWRRPECIEAIRDRLAPALARLPTFEFTATGLGAFPDARNARVIWAGISDPDNALSQIASIVEDELAEIGFARDRKPFHPHVTLGRVKRVDDVSRMLSQAPERSFSKTVVNRVTLFESIIKSSGPTYKETEIFGLNQRQKSDKRHTERLKPSAQTRSDSEVGLDAARPAEPTSPDEMDSGEKPPPVSRRLSESNNEP